MNSKKYAEYSITLLDILQEAVNEGRINFQNISEEGYATEFIHALANIVPAQVYSKITGEEIASLDFNYIANKLCVQSITHSK